MSNNGLFGEVPPGVDLTETQDVTLYSSVIALGVLATIAVILRVWARLVFNRDGWLTADDYIILFSLVWGWGTAACSLVSLRYGGGHHLWSVSADDLVNLWKVVFAYVMVYATAVTAAQISILLFYRRVFCLGKSLWLCGSLTISRWIMAVIVDIFTCRPLSYLWEQYATPDATGTCIASSKFYLACGISGIIVDVMILCTPIPTIMKLNMDRKQRAIVLSILFLGGFICIASIIRVIKLDALLTSKDMTWSVTGVFMWSCCEPFIGIVCACLPTYAPLVRRWIGIIRTRGSSGTGGKPSKTLGEGHTEEHSIPAWRNLNGTGWIGMKGESTRSRSPARDDEVRLTTIVAGGGDDLSPHNSLDDEDLERNKSGIVVKKEINWTSLDT